MNPRDVIRRDIVSASRFTRDAAEFDRRQTGIRPYSEREMAEAVEMRRRWNPQRKSILTAFESSGQPGSPQGAFMDAQRIEVDINFSLAAWNTVAEHRVIAITGNGIIEQAIYFISTGTAWASAGNLGTLDFGITGQQTLFFAARALPFAAWTGPAAGAGTFTFGSKEALGRAATSMRFDMVAVEPAAPFNIGYQINVEAFTAGTARVVMFYRVVSGNIVVAASTGVAPI